MRLYKVTSGTQDHLLIERFHQGRSMARYTGPKCKKCRRLRLSVCGSERCALIRRDNPPGMQVRGRRKISDYKKQLIEKQRLRYSYWLNEKQFRGYVKKALRKPGISGDNLVLLLERRLDSMIHRFGFAPTIPAARQMVIHGHILVNGSRVNKPSYAVRKGDVISVKETSKKMQLVKEGMERSQARPILSYFRVDKKNLRGILTEIPSRSEIP